MDPFFKRFIEMFLMLVVVFMILKCFGLFESSKTGFEEFTIIENSMIILVNKDSIFDKSDTVIVSIPAKLSFCKRSGKIKENRQLFSKNITYDAGHEMLYVLVKKRK